MEQERQLYINELSPEEKEILQLATMLKKMGKDPIKVLKLAIDAGATFEKVANFGKEAKNYIKQQWHSFEREFKKAKDEDS